jgi:hypothetical protein
MSRSRPDAILRSTVSWTPTGQRAGEVKNMNVIYRTLLAFTAVLAILALAVAPVAARATPFSFTFEDTFTDDTCGFLVERHNDGKGSGRLFFDAEGNLVGVDVVNAGVSTITSLDNGASVTEKFQVLFKNFNFVDNGDGTQSQYQTTVGASTLYDQNGEVLLRSHGPMTVHLTLIPTDTGPIIVSAEVVFEHGSHADTETYCGVLAGALGL